MSVQTLKCSDILEYFQTLHITCNHSWEHGREGVTQRKIEEAAKAAIAHSFISELPDGYDTKKEPNYQ